MAALAAFLDAALGELRNAHRGASAPDSPIEGQRWWDTSGGATAEVLKRYTAAAGWVSLLTMNVTTGAITQIHGILDENDMASDSAVLPPSQQSVKAYVDGAVVADGFGGQYKNLAIKNNTTHNDHQLDIAAAVVIVENASGATMRLDSFSATVDVAASGANGLDTGSEASSTWYHAWAIAKDDGTAAAILSASATAPTLPATYTHKAYLGAVYNAGDSNFELIEQKNNIVLCERVQVLNNGTQTSKTAIDLSAVVPPTAKVVYGDLYMNGGATFSASLVGETTGNMVFIAPSNGNLGYVFAIPLPKASTLYYNVSAQALSVYITGWQF
jgi:hypothetical protein